MFRLSVYEPLAVRVRTATGSSERSTFKMKVGSDGRRFLVESGKIDSYAQIQSHKDSCDIQYIMTRFANGDTSVLSKVQGLYGDFTGVPTSINELQQRVVDAERLFYQLPVETREKFEHNPSIFYNMIGTDDFNKIIGVDKSVDNPIANTPAPVVSPSSGGVNNESKSE